MAPQLNEYIHVTFMRLCVDNARRFDFVDIQSRGGEWPSGLRRCD